jgi:hypothetical protein
MTLIVVGAVAIVLVAVLAVAGAFSGGGAKSHAAAPTSAGTAAPSTASSPATSSPRRHRGAGAVGHLRVAVLNGTTVPGLARRVADRLVASGYRIGTVTNASNQQHPTTTVSYAPGAQAQAQSVAQQIGAAAGAVQPLDPSTQVIARGASVVVTVGADSSR